MKRNLVPIVRGECAKAAFAAVPDAGLVEVLVAKTDLVEALAARRRSSVATADVLVPRTPTA